MLPHPMTLFNGRKRPSIVGTPTVLKADDTANWSTKTFTATHTSATGNILILGGARSNNGTSPVITGCTWNGVALTQIDSEKLDGVGRPIGWAGYISGGVTGARDIVFSAGGPRDFMGWAIDIDDFAEVPIGGHDIVTSNAVANNVAVPITVLNQRSLLIGLACAYDEDISPMVASSPWTTIANDKTGNATSADIAGLLGSRIDPTPGSVTFTSTCVGANTTDDWLGIAIELLPY